MEQELRFGLDLGRLAVLKKRDFRIIRSKVGGLVTRSVGVYKFFV